MPRILFVGAHYPHGPSYGAQLRTLHIARILKKCGALGMVLFPYGEVDAATMERIKGEFDLRAILDLNQSISRTIAARLRRELDPYCARPRWGGLEAESAMIVERIARDYDLIWFHGIVIPNGLGRRSWPCSVLDIDDIQSQIHAVAAKGPGNLVRRMKSFRQTILWRRRERVLLDRFSIVSVCSEKDKHYLGGGGRIHTIPNGFEAPSLEPCRSPADPPRIGFIGTLRYAPNVEGLRWFIHKVWPRIKSVRSDARLRLVGLDTDTGIAVEGRDIDGLGFVDDVTTEISGWAMSIVPINVGGGTRIKIAEAFGRKCPVVSTSLGAYGYRVESGRECLLADSPEDMADACLRLLDDRKLGDSLAERAWMRFCSEWSWDAIAPRVFGAVDACLRSSGGSAV